MKDLLYSCSLVLLLKLWDNGFIRCYFTRTFTGWDRRAESDLSVFVLK